jgi:hypothetical protein
MTESRPWGAAKEKPKEEEEEDATSAKPRDRVSAKRPLAHSWSV